MSVTYLSERRITLNKNAFTLAEVLITLGIIGVVAAMTLPSIIQNKQKKDLEVSFKKSYTNFYNAFNKSKIMNHLYGMILIELIHIQILPKLFILSINK